MPTLNSQIQELAQRFAAGVLAAIRSASLEEILGSGGARASGASSPSRRGPGRPRKEPAPAPTKGPTRTPAKKTKGGRLPRRSASDIQHVIGLITAELGRHKEGLRSEQLQKALKLDKKEITGPLSLALSEKRISKKGQKRSTTYFAK
jgi:hypothetical protein